MKARIYLDRMELQTTKISPGFCGEGPTIQIRNERSVTNHKNPRYLILKPKMIIQGRGLVGWDPPCSFNQGEKMPTLPSWGGQPGRVGVVIISQYLILCKNYFKLFLSRFWLK